MTWGPTLTPDQEAILNAQIDSNLPVQISSYQKIVDACSDLIDFLDELSSLVYVFWYWFHDDVIAYYETEIRWLSGGYFTAPVTDADLDASMDASTPCRLYPSGYTDKEPKYIDELKGVFDVIEYECEDYQTGGAPNQGLHDVAFDLTTDLNAGLSGTGSGTGITQTLTPSSTQINVPVFPAFNGTPNRQISVVSNDLTVWAVFDYVSGINPLVGSFSSWSGPPSKNDAWILTQTAGGKTTNLDSILSLLSIALQYQIDALNLNADNISYSNVQSDILAAIAAATASKALYDAFNPGAPDYAGLLTALNNRMAYRAIREAQISTALSSVLIGCYDRRYRWLNGIVNRAEGSRWRKVRTEDTKTLVEGLKLDAELQLADYEEYRDG